MGQVPVTVATVHGATALAEPPTALVGQPTARTPAGVLHTAPAATLVVAATAAHGLIYMTSRLANTPTSMTSQVTSKQR